MRKICEHCKEPYRPTLEEITKMRIQGRDAETLASYKGAGCAHCNRTGYRGRVGVFEVLTVDATLRELIAKDAPEPALLKAAVANGMRYLLEDGLEKIGQGVTSIAELLRVIYIRDEETKKACQACGESISAEMKTCPQCGNTPGQRCPGCGGPARKSGSSVLSRERYLSGTGSLPLAASFGQP